MQIVTAIIIITVKITAIIKTNFVDLFEGTSGAAVVVVVTTLSQ